jgi:3-oxoacyl-[acyl-carrier protein] reductase
MNARDPGALAIATDDISGAVGVVGDVTQPLEASRVVTEAATALGGLDVLVCNVGGGRSVTPGSESPEEWHRMFGLNLWSATNTVEAAKDALIASRGVVVCVSSICGLEVIPGAPVTYSAAKAALHAYIRGVARPFGRFGVRINAVAPGNILFDGSVWAGKLADDKHAVEKMLLRDVSLGSLGSPEDVANLVTFLASPRSAFATGQIWTLDGGQSRS